MSDKRIFFLGAGRMATAIATGMVKKGNFEPELLSAYDPDSAAAERFTVASGVATIVDASVGVEKADVVVIAVKPQYLEKALASLMLEDKLIISIVAGTGIAVLTHLTGSERIVRVMPNTPALVGCGAGAYAVSEEVTSLDVEIASKVLEAIGEFYKVEERLLDAVTGLSGSGPAYVYEFIQALADGGVTAGLPRNMALRLAAQTVLGSAKMVLETSEHPIELRDQVMSPGGTTAQGILALAEGAFAAVTQKAVLASAAKSAEFARRK